MIVALVSLVLGLVFNDRLEWSLRPQVSLHAPLVDALSVDAERGAEFLYEVTIMNKCDRPDCWAEDALVSFTAPAGIRLEGPDREQTDPKNLEPVMGLKWIPQDDPSVMLLAIGRMPPGSTLMVWLKGSTDQELRASQIDVHFAANGFTEKIGVLQEHDGVVVAESDRTPAKASPAGIAAPPTASPGANLDSTQNSKPVSHSTVPERGSASLDQIIENYFAVIRRIDGQSMADSNADQAATINGDSTGDANLVPDGPELVTNVPLHATNEVFVDATGSLFIADPLNHQIYRVDSETLAMTAIAGNGVEGFGGDGGPASGAHLRRPRSISFDDTGNLFFVDEGNHRIRKVGVDGVISTVSDYSSEVSADDTGLAAMDVIPSDIAVDNSGNLYIADTRNHRILVLDAGVESAPLVFTYDSNGSSHSLTAGEGFSSSIAVGYGDTLFIAGDHGDYDTYFFDGESGDVITLTGMARGMAFRELPARQRKAQQGLSQPREVESVQQDPPPPEVTASLAGPKRIANLAWSISSDSANWLSVAPNPGVSFTVEGSIAQGERYGIVEINCGAANLCASTRISSGQDIRSTYLALSGGRSEHELGHILYGDFYTDEGFLTPLLAVVAESTTKYPGVWLTSNRFPAKTTGSTIGRYRLYGSADTTQLDAITLYTTGLGAAEPDRTRLRTAVLRDGVVRLEVSSRVVPLADDGTPVFSPRAVSNRGPRPLKVTVEKSGGAQLSIMSGVTDLRAGTERLQF